MFSGAFPPAFEGDRVKVVLIIAGQVGSFGEVLAEQALVFSFVPRCQGEWGSQKNTGMPVSVVNFACWAISRPWSQVRERFSSVGTTQPSSPSSWSSPLSRSWSSCCSCC